MVTRIKSIEEARTASLPIEYELPGRNGDLLSLDVTTGHSGYACLPVYSVSYMEWDAFSLYVEGGGFNVWNSESYMSEVEARAAFVRRARSADPFQAQVGNEIADLVDAGLRSSLNRFAGQGLVGVLSHDFDERAKQLFCRFFDPASSFFNGEEVHQRFNGDGSDEVQLPAWTLLKVRVTIAALQMAYYRIGGANVTWDTAYANSNFGDAVNAALEGLTSIGRDITNGRSEVVVTLPTFALQAAFEVMANASLSVDELLGKQNELA